MSGTTAEAVLAGCADRTIAPGVEVPEQARSYFGAAGLSDYYEQLRRR